MSVKSWLKFILLGLIWGSSFFWIKIGLQEASPLTVVFFRVAFALLGTSAYFLLTRRKFPWKAWKVFLFIGFFNVAMPFALVSWSETHISSALASILNALQPLTTSIIASIFIKEERLTPQRIAGLAIGFGGVLVLMSGNFSGHSTNQLWGILGMLAAVFGYGMSGVYARIHSKGIRPEDQALGQFIIGLMFVIPALLTIDAPFVLPVRLQSYVAFAWLGLLGSFFASITWYQLLKEIGPSRVSMTTYMFPLVGVLLGAIILREMIDWRVIVGGLMILGAIVLVNQRKKAAQAYQPVSSDQFEG